MIDPDYFPPLSEKGKENLEALAETAQDILRLMTKQESSRVALEVRAAAYRKVLRLVQEDLGILEKLDLPGYDFFAAMSHLRQGKQVTARELALTRKVLAEYAGGYSI